VVDLADDEGELVDPTFDDLDDPDGLLRNGLRSRAELLDDEDLDLLGDVDDGPLDDLPHDGIAERARDRAGAVGRTGR